LTVRDYHQLKELHEKYAEKGLVILGFPCNQFGFQEPGSPEEIPKCLNLIRPGNGFTLPFALTEKVQVNGEETHPIYKYLKASVPCETDILMSNPKYLIWSPIGRTDISWNFEKFLIDKEGKTFKRYGHKVPPTNFDAEIASLL
jgi:glutathione peroxidase